MLDFKDKIYKKFIALLANCRPECNCLLVTNTLAYFTVVPITEDKKVIIYKYTTRNIKKVPDLVCKL